MRIDRHHHIHLDPELARFLDWALKAQFDKLELIMAAIDDLKAKTTTLKNSVDNMTTKVDATVVKMTDMQAKLLAALAAAGGPNEADIQAVADSLGTEAAQLDKESIALDGVNTQTPTTT